MVIIKPIAKMPHRVDPMDSTSWKASADIYEEQGDDHARVFRRIAELMDRGSTGGTLMKSLAKRLRKELKLRGRKAIRVVAVFATPLYGSYHDEGTIHRYAQTVLDCRKVTLLAGQASPFEPIPDHVVKSCEPVVQYGRHAGHEVAPVIYCRPEDLVMLCGMADE